MIGLSRTTAAEQRAMAIALREPMTANSQRVTPPVTMPSGKARMIVHCDLSPADRQNPNVTLFIIVEVSTNGGQSYGQWGRWSIVGSATRNTSEPATFTIFPLPPVNSLVRVRYALQGSQGLSAAGVAVRCE